MDSFSQPAVSGVEDCKIPDTQRSVLGSVDNTAGHSRRWAWKRRPSESAVAEVRGGGDAGVPGPDCGAGEVEQRARP